MDYLIIKYLLNTHSMVSIILNVVAKGNLGQEIIEGIKILKQSPFEFRRQEKTCK